jgi:hypothetical protein
VSYGMSLDALKDFLPLKPTVYPAFAPCCMT